MREQIENMQYRGKRTQLIKAQPPPMKEIQGRVYETVDYGWGPTLVDTNAVGGPRSSYEQSAKAALEASIAESKRRRDVAPSLTTKETQEALLAADTARKSRLGISETYAPPGSSGTSSASGTRRTAGATATPGANVMDVRPDLTAYKPPDLGSFDNFKVSDNGFDRFGTTVMADSERRNKYFEDNQASRPGSAIAVSESGKVVRVDPTPKYKSEESMTPDEMRQNRPALDATRRNYDLAKEEQAHADQVAAETAAAKAEAAAKEKQADRDANRTLEELKQMGGMSKEVVGAYSEQLKALQEQISSGSKVGPNGVPMPMTEDEMVAAQAEKANLFTEIRALRNQFSKGSGVNIGDAINKVIQAGETPPPGPPLMASHSPYTALAAPAVTPEPAVSRAPAPATPPPGTNTPARGRAAILNRYLKPAPPAPQYEYTPRDPKTGQRPLTPMTPMTPSKRPVTKLPAIPGLLVQPGERKKKKKEKQKA